MCDERRGLHFKGAKLSKKGRNEKSAHFIATTKKIFLPAYGSTRLSNKIITNITLNLPVYYAFYMIL
jgi:hypothetical protein